MILWPVGSEVRFLRLTIGLADFNHVIFSGCAGLLVGHPFDTLKVIVLSLRSIFQVLETTSFKAKAGVT